MRTNCRALRSKVFVLMKHLPRPLPARVKGALSGNRIKSGQFPFFKGEPRWVCSKRALTRRGSKAALETESDKLTLGVASLNQAMMRLPIDKRRERWQKL